MISALCTWNKSIHLCENTEQDSVCLHSASHDQCAGKRSIHLYERAGQEGVRLQSAGLTVISDSERTILYNVVAPSDSKAILPLTNRLDADEH